MIMGQRLWKYIVEHQLIGFWSWKINKYNSEYVYKETVSERLWLTQGPTDTESSDLISIII